MQRDHHSEWPRPGSGLLKVGSELDLAALIIDGNRNFLCVRDGAPEKACQEYRSSTPAHASSLAMKAMFLLPHLRRAQPFLQLAQAAHCSSPQFSHAPLPVPVIKRVTEPARRQNASKCHHQGSDKRCPQEHRGSHYASLMSGEHPLYIL
jgi:hypothetical protein